MKRHFGQAGNQPRFGEASRAAVIENEIRARRETAAQQNLS